jgi:hypothetical protein
MRPQGWLISLLLTVSAWAGAAWAADLAPPPADSAGAAAPADSTWCFSLILDHDETFLVAKVEPGGQDYVRAVRPDGRVSYIPAYRVRSIRDPQGKDWTHQVLDRRKSVGIGVDQPSAPRSFAMSSGPLPGTRSFMITQVGVAARVDAGSPLYNKGDAYAFADLGWMRNVSRRLAVGGNMYVGGDDYRLRFGPKLRLRYWVSRAVSVDLAPGVLLWGDEDWHGDAHFPGWVGEASLSCEDVLLTAEVESIDISDWYGAEDRDTSWYVGGKIGGVPGMVGLFAGIIALAMIHVTLEGVAW